jgi:hypothetical protein
MFIECFLSYSLLVYNVTLISCAAVLWFSAEVRKAT